MRLIISRKDETLQRKYADCQMIDVSSFVAPLPVGSFMPPCFPALQSIPTELALSSSHLACEEALIFWGGSRVNVILFKMRWQIWDFFACVRACCTKVQVAVLFYFASVVIRRMTVNCFCASVCRWGNGDRTALTQTHTETHALGPVLRNSECLREESKWLIV